MRFRAFCSVPLSLLLGLPLCGALLLAAPAYGDDSFGVEDRTDVPYNICMRHCRAVSVYDVSLDACEKTCAETRRAISYGKGGYRSYESCLKDMRKLELKRDILTEDAKEWCTGQWTHLHKIYGCREAIDSYYAAVTQRNMCDSFPASTMPAPSTTGQTPLQSGSTPYASGGAATDNGPGLTLPEGITAGTVETAPHPATAPMAVDTPKYQTPEEVAKTLRTSRGKTKAASAASKSNAKTARSAKTGVPQTPRTAPAKAAAPVKAAAPSPAPTAKPVVAPPARHEEKDAPMPEPAPLSLPSAEPAPSSPAPGAQPPAATPANESPEIRPAAPASRTSPAAPGVPSAQPAPQSREQEPAGTPAVSLPQGQQPSPAAPAADPAGATAPARLQLPETTTPRAATVPAPSAPAAPMLLAPVTPREGAAPAVASPATPAAAVPQAASQPQVPAPQTAPAPASATAPSPPSVPGAADTQKSALSDAPVSTEDSPYPSGVMPPTPSMLRQQETIPPIVRPGLK